MEALQDYGSDADRIEYINRLKEEKQNFIINTKRPETSSVYIYTWTHRTTGCDVISTVTTTLPMKNGNMKDIKMYNKEMKRFVLLLFCFFAFLFSSPSDSLTLHSSIHSPTNSHSLPTTESKHLERNLV